jgi:hypothetical protein
VATNIATQRRPDFCCIHDLRRLERLLQIVNMSLQALLSVGDITLDITAVVVDGKVPVERYPLLFVIVSSASVSWSLFESFHTGFDSQRGLGSIKHERDRDYET